jgi:hypothetical protein
MQRKTLNMAHNRQSSKTPPIRQSTLITVRQNTLDAAKKSIKYPQYGTSPSMQQNTLNKAKQSHRGITLSMQQNFQYAAKYPQHGTSPSMQQMQHIIDKSSFATSRD